jgi:hypothetical protein
MKFTSYADAVKGKKPPHTVSIHHGSNSLGDILVHDWIEVRKKVKKVKDKEKVPTKVPTSSNHRQVKQGRSSHEQYNRNSKKPIASSRNNGKSTTVSRNSGMAIPRVVPVTNPTVGKPRSLTAQDRFAPNPAPILQKKVAWKISPPLETYCEDCHLCVERKVLTVFATVVQVIKDDDTLQKVLPLLNRHKTIPELCTMSDDLMFHHHQKYKSIPSINDTKMTAVNDVGSNKQQSGRNIKKKTTETKHYKKKAKKVSVPIKITRRIMSKAEHDLLNDRKQPSKKTTYDEYLHSYYNDFDYHEAFVAIETVDEDEEAEDVPNTLVDAMGSLGRRITRSTARILNQQYQQQLMYHQQYQLLQFQQHR